MQNTVAIPAKMTYTISEKTTLKEQLPDYIKERLELLKQ